MIAKIFKREVFQREECRERKEKFMDKPLGGIYTVKEIKKESTSIDLIFYFNLAREAKERNMSRMCLRSEGERKAFGKF